METIGKILTDLKAIEQDDNLTDDEKKITLTKYVFTTDGEELDAKGKDMLELALDIAKLLPLEKVIKGIYESLIASIMTIMQNEETVLVETEVDLN